MTPEQSKLLGQIDQKLTDMCSNNTREHKEIKEELKTIKSNVRDDLEHISDQREGRIIECNRMFDQRLKTGLFIWIIGGIFSCLVLIGGFLYNIDNKVDNHIARAREAYHQITGQEYTPPADYK